MNTTILTKKYLFQFRGEDSVKNAISKISELLFNYNRDTSNTTNETIFLNISGSKQSGITFYKKEFNIYDKSNNFTKSLKAMEKQLTNCFTEIRLKDLASIIEVSKDKPDIVDVTLEKGIAKTLVSLNLFIAEGDVSVKNTSKKSSKKLSFKPLKIIAEGDLPVVSVSLKTPQVKRGRKVVSTPSVKKDILKGIANLKEELPSLIIPKVSRKASKVISNKSTPKSDIARAGTLGLGLLNLSKHTSDSLISNSLTPFIRGIFNISSNYVPTIDNILTFLSNLSLIIPNFYSNAVGFLLFMFYIMIYVIVLVITVIITGLNIYMQEVPYLLDYLQHMNITLPTIEGDWSIFENIINILKNIKPDSPIPEILPEIIKEAESLIGTSIPEVVKEVISNTIITLSENVSSDVTPSPEEGVKQNLGNENNEEALTREEDKDENKNSIFINILYAVIYGTVGIVALDYISRLPTDPEFLSHCGDLVGGVISIGIYSITSILQMLFGDSDNSTGSSSTTSESLNKGKSDYTNNMQTIEYKKDPQPSILDKAKGLFIKDKPESNNKSSESRNIFNLGSNHERGESSNSKSNNSRANAILGVGDSLPSFNFPKMPSLNTPYIPSLPDLPSMPNLPTISNPFSSDDTRNALSKSGGKLLKNIANTGGDLLNGASSTGGVILNGASNTGNALLNGASNTGDALLKGASNTGDTLLNGVSRSGGTLINGVSNTGDALIKGVSSTGKNIINGISDTFYTNQSKIPVPSRLVSPWGASFSDPSIKEDGNSLLESTKKFFKRQGDNTFTEIAPNEGPLPTNLRESMIPMITLNNSSQHIELEPYLEESETEGGTEVIYIINNVTPSLLDEPFPGDPAHEIMQLERNIMDHSEYINLEDRKDQRSIIQNYGEQIRLLSEGLDERDEIIQRTGDVLMFQEKEIKTLIEVERHHHSRIIGQTNELDDNLLELTSQSETIQSQKETINQQESVIKIQRDAVQKSLFALNTLTNNIQFDNGKSLLSKEDVKILVESITDTADMETTQTIKPRFEEISSRALYTINEEVETYPQYLGQRIGSENNLLLEAPLDNPPRSTSLNQHENPPRSTSLQNDLPTRSTSLKVPSEVHNEPLTRSSSLQNELLTRSTSLPDRAKEFWNPQPDNTSAVAKIKWKYGL